MHALSPLAGCGDCVTACPHDALSYDGTGVVLAPDACTGCGHCVGACPVRAVTIETPPLVRRGDTLIRVCQRHPAARGRPAPVCIQGAGLQEAAGWLLSGVRRVACGTGDCATCPDAPAQGLDSTLAMLGPHAPALTRATPDELRDWARQAGDGPAPARRAFLRGIAAPLMEENTEARPLARLQSTAEVFIYAPVIDPAHCTGCDACVKLCPEDALSRSADPPAYVADPAACTACFLCVDVCADEAISVMGEAAAPDPVTLITFTCRACGALAHVPAEGPRAGDKLCPICAQTGHHKKLFQVY